MKAWEDQRASRGDNRLLMALVIVSLALGLLVAFLVTPSMW